MQTTKNKPVFFGSKVWCSLFGHQFVTKDITNHFKEYKCSKCRLELTNDEKGKRIFLTPEHRDINQTLVMIYQKRHPIA
ncbi:MAG TPA: hypothetical protein VK476_04565 [Flavobacterium sp.]|nr:hypothetical protein [Flavobacterium sp.]